MSPTGDQRSTVATSRDGIRFDARPEKLGNPYLRVFHWGGFYYAMGMPGVLYRSRDGLEDFEPGPTLFNTDMRHCALKLDEDVLRVFYSNAGDCPERIVVSLINLKPDWREWRANQPATVLEPETDYEGADLPLAPSLRGQIRERVRQLRDPAIFEEEGRTYLLYSVAGEYGIAMAELQDL